MRFRREPSDDNLGEEDLGPDEYRYEDLTQADRSLLRPLVVDGEMQFVLADDSREANKIEAAFDLQYGWPHGTVSESRLAALSKARGARLHGRSVTSDPDALDAVARRGDLDPAELYREFGQ